MGGCLRRVDPMSSVVDGPYVSIVLVTRNGADTLPAVLDAIESQEVPFEYEVIAVDSGSTDGTADLLRSRVHSLTTIAQDDFNHGATRNLAIEHSNGVLVVMLVQDAIPTSTTWLATLTAPFAIDQRLAGTFSRQVPHTDASAIARLYLSKWFATGERGRRVMFARAEDLSRLSTLEQLDQCTFDNVCSCIRRSVWKDRPFARTPIAEDLEWAKAVLVAGYSLQYVPEAAVAHSHDRPPTYEFARTYALHRRLFQLFGVRTVPTAGVLIRAIGSTLRVHLDCLRRADPPESMRSTWRGVALAVAWPVAQYLGALSAVKGWTPIRFRGV